MKRKKIDAFSAIKIITDELSPLITIRHLEIQFKEFEDKSLSTSVTIFYKTDEDESNFTATLYSRESMTLEKLIALCKVYIEQINPKSQTIIATDF